VGVEPGSFRDRDARVFYADGAVFRALSQTALDNFRALANTRFFPDAMSSGRIVQSDLVDPLSVAGDLPPGSWAGVLRHETIPTVSYPYEWSFGMLKEAALLQLDLIRGALDEDLSLKDATPFNVQFRGAQPVFIDVASFERREAGDPWPGYRQFCQTFLYPLMLQAYKGVSFRPWLRGRLEGVEPGDCRRLMSVRDWLRPGVLRHVHLHASVERREEAAVGSVKAELRAARFPVEAIRHNVAGLRRLVAGLAWNRASSAWSGYAGTHSYSSSDQATKAAFVDEAIGSRPCAIAWDLGCNTGEYSRILARHAKQVVAIDADELAVERFHAALKGERHASILPLVMDVTDPSPALGWRLAERRALGDRRRPDFLTCLALVHHVVVGGNVPLAEFVEWLAGLSPALVIEFVSKADPMAQRLLANKRDTYADYDLEHFEACLTRHYTVRRRQPLSSGTRVLYFATADRV
jgi:hypothetical protein